MRVDYEYIGNVQKMSGIQRYFYGAASPECDISKRIYKPAVAFEVATGITGISRHYIFPDNMTPAAYEMSIDYVDDVARCYKGPDNIKCDFIRISNLDPQLMKHMQEQWKKLKFLNPVLEKIRFDINEPTLLFDALKGASCLFNVDDIDFFIRMQIDNKSFGVSGMAYEQVDGYAALMGAVGDLVVQYNGGVGWVPAPQTLQTIKKKLETVQSTRSSFVP